MGIYVMNLACKYDEKRDIFVTDPKRKISLQVEGFISLLKVQKIQHIRSSVFHGTTVALLSLQIKRKSHYVVLYTSYR